jgi:branched-chain amino acid transport system substrate-binding protein
MARSVSLKNLFSVVSVLSAVILVLAGCSAGAPSYKGTIKIGVAVPLSGDLADGGDSVDKGARLQAERINKQGGLLGYKIEVVSMDDEADDGVAMDVAAELIKDGVKMVVGHYNSGQSIPTSAVYAKARVIMITPTSSNPALTRQNLSTVFRVNPTDEAQGPQLARFAIQKLGKQRIAIIHDESDYTKGLAAEFTKAAQGLGVTPVLTILAPSGRDSYSDVLQKVQAANPELVFGALDYPAAEVILLNKKELGMTNEWLLGDACFQYEVILTTGSASEGVYISSFSPSIRGVDRPDAKDFVKEYRDLFGRNPGPDSVPGALALDVWARAVKAAGKFDADAVATAIKKLSFTAPITNLLITYDQKGDLASPVIYISQVKDGQFIAIETK